MRNTSADRRATWAAYVTAVRQATGISRPELARRLDVDPTTVWRWETGRQAPESIGVPTAFAQLFGLDIDDVLAAAGLKPYTTPRARPRPVQDLDPDVEVIHRRLADPEVDEREKQPLREALRALAALADRGAARRPRRRRSA